MPVYFYVWTDEIVEHLAEHGVTPEEFQHVMENPTKRGRSDSTNRPCVWGYTEDGRFLLAVYQKIDAVTILPVTAYEVPEQRQKKRRRKK